MMGGASLVTVVLGIIRMKAAAVTIGPAGVGLIGLYQNYIGLAIGVIGFGIASAVPREIAAERAARGEAGEAAVKRAVKVVTLTLAAAGLALAIMFLSLLGGSGYTATTMPEHLGWLSIALALGIISSSQMGLLTGQGYLREAANSSIFGAAVATVAAVSAFVLFPRQAPVLAITATYVASFLASSWFSRKVERPRAEFATVPLEFAIVKRLFVLGITITSASMFPLLSLLFVRHAILGHGGETDLGLMQASWSIASMYVMLILQAMTADFYPRLSSLVKKPAEFAQLVNDQTEVALLIGGPIVLAVLGCAPLVISILYGAEFHGAATTLRWQLLGDVLKIASWPFGFALLACGKRLSFIFSEAVAAMVLGLVGVLLIPFLGLVAVGIAYVIMYLVYFPLVFFLASRRSKLRWTRGVVVDFALLLIAAVCLLALVPLNQFGAAFAGIGVAVLYGIRSFRRLRHLIPKTNVRR